MYVNKCEVLKTFYLGKANLRIKLILRQKETQQTHQLISVSQTALHTAISVDTVTVTLKRSIGINKSKPAITTHNTNDCVGAVFDAMCSISSDSQQRNNRILAIDHHLYDNLSDTWIRKPSKPQPFVNHAIRILPEDYEAFCFNITTRTNTVAISAMADTGCQSCLSGIRVIYRLCINENELIPVNMKMDAASNKGIMILGASILHISDKDGQGRHVETRQMTSVTDNSDKLLLTEKLVLLLE